MMSYPRMAEEVKAYLLEIEALDRARQFGTFRGGAVIQLADDHYIAALLPAVDPDEALINCLAYLQDMDLYGWDVMSEVQIGSGTNTMTVLHIHPPSESAK